MLTAKDEYTITLPVSGDLRSPSPTLVRPESPIQIRQSVELLARYFMKEMRISGIQFDAAETRDKSWFVPYEAYLFHVDAFDVSEEENPVAQRIFGACCFRWRTWDDVPAGWTLDWIWMHPFFRARGHLRKAWPKFEQKYGKFYLQRPSSCAMESFLKKIGWLESNHASLSLPASGSGRI